MCYALSVDWRVTFYSSRVEDAILRLPAGLLARFVRYAETMESFGPQLGMPHSRALGGGLYELRLKGPDGIATRLVHGPAGPKDRDPSRLREEDGEDTAKGAGYSTKKAQGDARCLAR